MIIKCYFLNELEREKHENMLLNDNVQLDKEFILALDDIELLELFHTNQATEKIYVQ